MSTRKKIATIALATAAAAFFTAAPISVAQAGGDGIHCFGVNKCKGHNDCKSGAHGCKGKASCKGKGFVTMSKHACEEIGGSVDKPKK